MKINRQPLDTMPEWAQEVVYNEAFGLLRDESSTWEWYENSNSFVLIRSHGFTYIAGPKGMCR